MFVRHLSTGYASTMRSPLFLISLVATLACSAAAAVATTATAPVLATSTPAPSFRVLETIKLPGATRWDYLVFSAESQRLYLTRGDSVDVYDTVAKRIVGSIADTKGVHGVALAPELNRGFTSNGQDNTVTVFELDSLKKIGTVPTDKRPDAIVYDAFTKRVFTANAMGENLTAIDAITLKVLATIKVEGKPEFVVVDGKGRLFVNIEPKNQLAVIDTAKLSSMAKYDLSSACDEPAGLSIDLARMRLFAGCHNQKMVVVDGNNGKILAALPIGKGSDATVYDSQLDLAVSSNGEGTLTFVGLEKDGSYIVKQTLKTMPSARTMALDPQSHKIYLVAAEFEPAVVGADGKPSVIGADSKPARPKVKADSFTVITVAP